MKILFIAFFAFLFTPAIWLGNFTDAQKEAQTAHKLILINFSGSDWCIPCMRLRKEILESNVFEDYAKDKLILVRADFPRQKKNQLSKEQVKLNENLADKYNKDGKFPFTLLVDENGKVVKTWEGFPDESPLEFVQVISNLSK
ncbi:thioredoxin family protein [Pedobacter changchengzhani]|uniref:Thioredoxin family protein n=1 Tax=Pedobacter changchengzhani TaxID=2529274 RepID=A0A4R5MHD8_9SPHI|nr:thioredoxin family protein [Pedobacter changchengzhani]TDG34938.1 thioredoxin family protein [Pedobacter changchengzhani]